MTSYANLKICLQMTLFLKKIPVALATLLACIDMSAQQNREPTSERYSITVLGVYDHSRTFANQGGFDIAGHMPFNTYVEADAGFESLGPKILAGTFVARPKLPLKVGELFLDAAGRYRNIYVYTHTNFFNTDNTQITSGNFSLEETHDLMSLFSSYGVSCVLTGHDHYFENCIFREVSYYTLNALCNEPGSYYKAQFGKELQLTELTIE